MPLTRVISVHTCDIFLSCISRRVQEVAHVLEMALKSILREGNLIIGLYAV